MVVVPGLLGSRLVVPGTGRSVWGDFEQGASDPRTVEGAGLFAFPMQLGVPLHRLQPSTDVDGTVGMVKGRIAGVPVRVRVYSDVLSSLGVASYGGSFGAGPRADAGAGSMAFEFAYDFRRSIDELACRLAAFLRQASRFVQLQRGNHDPVRFDLVAHSQGGLVLRYLLRYGGRLLPLDGLPEPSWEGAELVETAVIVGTPSGGAALAFERLLGGVPGNPLHRPYGPVLMSSFPSGYQLLPRVRHDPVQPLRGHTSDPLDPDFFIARDVGLVSSRLDADLARVLPGVEGVAARRDVAEDHLRKCLARAAAFQAAMDCPMPPPPPHLKLHLFLGDAHPTAARVAIPVGENSVQVLDQAPGDGTVLRRSALLDEQGDGSDLERVVSPIRWRSVTTLRRGHVALIGDPQLLAQLPALLGRDARH
ncbi:MAG: hypothetical protein DRQ55_01845 [Planctomycetota bacterium]|nr:MAG: hypothetical protein DRQ55_01845 [Planctomycetota bacterium]